MRSRITTSRWHKQSQRRSQSQCREHRGIFTWSPKAVVGLVPHPARAGRRHRNPLTGACSGSLGQGVSLCPGLSRVPLWRNRAVSAWSTGPGPAAAVAALPPAGSPGARSARGNDTPTSTSRLAMTAVAPSTINRGSVSWTPNTPQQSSSPEMSSQVPRETPVVSLERHTVHTDGVTWSRRRRPGPRRAPYDRTPRLR